MTKPIQEMSSWNPSGHSRTEEEDTWEATRQVVGPATQMVGDMENYLAATDVGRRVADGQWELFVVCDPGEAIHLQFDHLRPEYIALHDVGTTSSRRLLAGLAAATGATIQKLTIRRRGQGIALATLEFIELPAAQARPLRLYTTEVDADTASRRELARMLLAYSRLGAVMVGELPPHALEPALRPLRDAIAAGPWPNRQLLMLPLSPASALTAQAAQMARGSAVCVRTTPQVTRPAEAWNFIIASWNKLREQVAPTGTVLPMLAAPVRASTTSTPAATVAAPAAVPAAEPGPARQAGAVSPPAASSSQSFTPAFGAARSATSPSPIAPLPMRPMPTLERPSAAVVPEAPMAAYVRRVAEIKGMVSCCLFELATQRSIAHAGSRPGPASLASQGAAMLAAMAASARLMGLGDVPPDAAVTLGAHHLLLRPVPNHHGLALHAVLDRGVANLTLVRLQLQRLDEML